HRNDSYRLRSVGSTAQLDTPSTHLHAGRLPASMNRYGSSSDVPSTWTRPAVSQQETVWPPTAITRLTKSFSLGGAMPMTEPRDWPSLPSQLDGPGIDASGVQV